MPKGDKIIDNTAHHADIRCGTCGNVSTVERDCGGAALESWRCQGAVPDQCLNEMCEHEDCKVMCDYCRLPVCEDHRVKHFSDLICQNCRKEAADLALDVNAAQAKIIADKILCCCAELENDYEPGWEWCNPPACPVHGTLLYGGEPEIVREPVEVSEVEGCPF